MEMMKNHTVHTGEKRQGKYQTEKKKEINAFQGNL